MPPGEDEGLARGGAVDGEHRERLVRAEALVRGYLLVAESREHAERFVVVVFVVVVFVALFVVVVVVALVVVVAFFVIPVVVVVVVVALFALPRVAVLVLRSRRGRAERGIRRRVVAILRVVPRGGGEPAPSVHRSTPPPSRRDAARRAVRPGRRRGARSRDAAVPRARERRRRASLDDRSRQPRRSRARRDAATGGGDGDAARRRRDEPHRLVRETAGHRSTNGGRARAKGATRGRL